MEIFIWQDDWLQGTAPCEDLKVVQEDIRERLNDGKRLRRFLQDYIATRPSNGIGLRKNVLRWQAAFYRLKFLK